MWFVYEEKLVTKSLNKIPKEIQLRYKAWVELVKNGGSSNLKNYPGFRDERLKGKLQNYRSSRLNIKYRVIYTEDKNEEEIIVEGITPHDYQEFL